MNISITRQTTALFKFKRINEKGDIITASPDNLYFTIQQSFNTKKHILQKTLKNGDITFDGEYYHIEFTPKDTEDLAYGEYAFDIKVLIDNKIIPILKEGTLTITDSTNLEVDN